VFDKQEVCKHIVPQTTACVMLQTFIWVYL